MADLKVYIKENMNSGDLIAEVFSKDFNDLIKALRENLYIEKPMQLSRTDGKWTAKVYEI